MSTFNCFQFSDTGASVKEAVREVECKDIENVQDWGSECWRQYRECGGEDERMRTPGGEDRTGYGRRKTRSSGSIELVVCWSHPAHAICIPAMPVFKPRSCSPAPLQWAPQPPRSPLPGHTNTRWSCKIWWLPTNYHRKIIFNVMLP